MRLKDVLDAKKHDPNYGIRYKQGGNAMLAGPDGVIWTLTDTYFKLLEVQSDRFMDWEAMLPTDIHHGLIKAAEEGQGYITFMGREIMIFGPNEPAKPTLKEPDLEEDRAPVSLALKSAGQVAEALGIAIQAYVGIDKSKADAALEQLLWIAKNVAWESKSNRRRYEGKWNKPEESKDV